MTGVLPRGEGTQTQREDGCVKMETKNGVMLTQIKGCLGLPEAR